MTENSTRPPKTALLVAGIVVGLSVWIYIRGHQEVAFCLAAMGASLFLAGLASPSCASRFHKAWMKLAAALGYVNSRVLLGIVYFLVFTPVGVLTRLGGKDPLNRRRGKHDSYWVPRTSPRQPREQFERLF